MANVKITDLTAYTDAASTDVLPVVDVSNDVTKKISIADLLKAAPLGSAAAPGIAFDGDPNTGVYSPGADQVAISTGGSQRLLIDSSGRLGIGTASPLKELQINATTPTIRLEESSASAKRLELSVSSSAEASIFATQSATQLLFGTVGTERARIDSSGRLLVGTSSSVSNVYLGGNAHQQPVQVVTATNSYANGLTALNYSASGFAPVISLGLSKSNSLGSNTAVASGDDLGIINFVGNDGTNFRSGAFILAAADGGVSTGDLPTRLTFSTTADGANSPTERMRIANTGATNVFASTANVLGAGSNQAAGTTYYLFYGANNASNTTTGTTCFLVFTNGNVQNTNNSYAGISDAKLKENIVDATSQWSDIKALQVRKYNFKEGQTHTQIGLIAQEVELVSPGLVTESPDRDAEGNNLGTVTKSVNYSVLYMKAVKALQEAMERIETLEAKVAALEGA